MSSQEFCLGGQGYAPAGMVFHVINRGVGRQTIFHKDEDYARRGFDLVQPVASGEGKGYRNAQ